MKILHDLMDYFREYYYDPREQKMMISFGPNAEKANAIYEKAVELVRLEDKKECKLFSLRTMKYGEEDDHSDIDDVLYVSHKWMLDIAIDVARQMTDEIISYVKKHMNYTHYHLSAAMQIRNQYIHHLDKYWREEAESISKVIMNIIFSIIDLEYDFRNPECVSFFADSKYSNISEEYEESDPELFKKVKSLLLADNSTMKSGEAVDLLRSELREKYGKKEFARLLKEFLNELDEKNEKWMWDCKWPGMAVLFPLEAKQVKCLYDLKVLNWVRYGRDFPDITKHTAKDCIDKCKALIDSELGLKEEYAQFIAETFIIAFMADWK